MFIYQLLNKSPCFNTGTNLQIYLSIYLTNCDLPEAQSNTIFELVSFSFILPSSSIHPSSVFFTLTFCPSVCLFPSHLYFLLPESILPASILPASILPASILPVSIIPASILAVSSLL